MAASAAVSRASSQATRWASGAFLFAELPVRPAMPTEFELLIEKRELAGAPHLWQYDGEIQKWVRENKNKKFIPESLLRELGEDVLED